VPDGAAAYVAALATQVQQGLKGHVAVLALFTAGLMGPSDLEGSPFGAFYEAAVRRAFRWRIDKSTAFKDEVHNAVTGVEYEQGLDLAYEAAARQGSRYRRRYEQAEREAARLLNAQPRTREQMKTASEQNLIALALGRDAADLGALEAARAAQPEWQHRVFLDAPFIVASPAPRAVEPTRTTEVFHEVLERASFAELHQARAIGGMIAQIAPVLRMYAASRQSPQARAIAATFQGTMFRDLFNQPWLMTQRPDGIVLPTLAFASWKARLQAGAFVIVQCGKLLSTDPSIPDIGNLERCETTLRPTADKVAGVPFSGTHIDFVSGMLTAGWRPMDLLLLDGVVEAHNLMRHPSRPERQTGLRRTALARPALRPCDGGRTELGAAPEPTAVSIARNAGIPK